MSILGTFPVNYKYGRNAFSVDASDVRTAAPEIQDNDHSTFSTEKKFAIETHGDSRSENTLLNHIYIRGTGITNYTVTVPTGKGTGMALSGAVIPDSGTVNGVQHDFRGMGPMQATEVEITITGSSVRIYEIMLFEVVINTGNVWTVINPSVVDRGRIINRNIRGNTIVTPGVEGRQKRITGYTGIFHGNNDNLADRLLIFFNENSNFVWAEDIDEWPDRVYAAYLSGGVDTAYLGRLFNQRQLSITVAEI